jgi:hypothetical protein
MTYQASLEYEMTLCLARVRAAGSCPDSALGAEGGPGFERRRVK